MPDEAVIKSRRRLPAIWIVPAVAVVLGLWMVVFTYLSEGPQITIRFATAEGIEAGKTKIKALSVDVGLVESVALSEGTDYVVVHAQLEPFAAQLLREDTSFWVVRARVGLGGVSGLGTLLSGGYIELEPGEGESGRRDFLGLEDAPVTPAGTPGVKITVVRKLAGSLNVGDPVLYKGFTVGQVESEEFDVETEVFRHDVFINAPYNDLLTTSTRFWSASGISLSMTADGIEVSMGSLETLVAGGISFGLPEDAVPGSPVTAGMEFELFASEGDANERANRHYTHYVVSFTQSVSGLNKGAPVRYRGIRVGTVDRILIDELVSSDGEGKGRPIPVLIRLEPARFGLGDSREGIERIKGILETAVGYGFRATLQSGNLLTGALYVGFDIHEDVDPVEIGEFAGYPTLPSISGGLAQIELKVAQLLDKLNALPIEPAVRSADRTLRQLDKTLAEVNTLIGSADTQRLPAALEAALDQLRLTLEGFSADSPLYRDLDRSVSELDETLRGLQSLSRTLDQKPNALVFGGDRPQDPEPKAGPR